MNRTLLATAREDWAWSHTSGTRRPPDLLESGDDLIAMAVGCVRQTRQRIAPLTIDDAEIIARRISEGTVFRVPRTAQTGGEEGFSVDWSADDIRSLRYLINLNA